jgi:hypothetical protein
VVKQASELTKNVNDKVKDGSLMSSLSYGVTNVGSTLSTVGSKAFSNLNSFWSGGSGSSGGMSESMSSNNMSSGTATNSGFFGRMSYDTVPGESSNNNYGNYNSNNNSNYDDNRNEFMKSSSSNAKDEWNNWDDATWESTKTSSTSQKAKSKTSSNNINNNNNGNNNKPQGQAKKAADLINFEEAEDNEKWESW